MRVRVLGLSPAVLCLLATACAAPTRNLSVFLDAIARELHAAAAASNLHHLSERTQDTSSSSSSTDTISTSPQHQLTLVDRSASSINKPRQRSRRRAIVNGFASWDYEPFDKMGAFRSGRGQ